MLPTPQKPKKSRAFFWYMAALCLLLALGLWVLAAGLIAGAPAAPILWAVTA